MKIQVIVKVKTLLILLNAVALVYSLSDSTTIIKTNTTQHVVDLQVSSEELSKTSLSVPVSPFLLKLTIKDGSKRKINDDLLLDLTKNHLSQEYEEYFRFQLDSFVLKLSPFPGEGKTYEQFVFRGFAFFKFPPLPETTTLEKLTYYAFQGHKKDLFLKLLWAKGRKFRMVKDVEMIVLGVETPTTLPPSSSAPEDQGNDKNFIGLLIIFAMVVVLSVAIVGILFYVINKRSRSNSANKKKEAEEIKNIPSTPTKSSFPQDEIVATPKTTFSISSYSSVGSSMSNSSNRKYSFSIGSFNFDDHASFSITSIDDKYQPSSDGNSQQHLAIDISSIQQMTEFSDGRFDEIFKDKNTKDFNVEDKNDKFQCSNDVWNDAELPSFELTEDSDSYFDSQSM